MTTSPIHGRITGPIVMIGFGSIGKGMLPLIERHFDFDRNRLVVIDTSDKDRHLLDARGMTFVSKGLTPENYREILTPLLTEGDGQGFRVNLSVGQLAGIEAGIEIAVGFESSEGNAGHRSCRKNKKKQRTPMSDHA